MYRPAILALCAVLSTACATHSEREISQAFQRRQIGDAKLAKAEYEMAIREYEMSISLFDGDPEAHFGLAEAYRRKQKPELAEKHLLRAIKLRPDHHEARLNLSVLYLEQERWADSMRISQALVDDPTFIRPARALVNNGWARYKSGDLGGARASLEQALKSERSNVTAHLDLGIVLYEQGEVLDAIRHFEEVTRILETRPVEVFGATEAEARFRAAQGFVKLGKRAEAVTHLEVAARRGGTSEWGQKSRDYLSILK